MGDWECIHVGTEADDLRIHGVQIWRLSWRPTGGDIRLPSPSYPEKQHNFTIYEAGDPQNPIRFAAPSFPTASGASMRLRQ